jgi:serine/threonine protein kinase
MHPNIVQVLDVGEVGGALYLAMEYVRGKDLRDVIKALRANNAMLPLGAVCYVVREIAQALHHAYWSSDLAGKQLSVVHRDVSPHNVMLGFDGTVKLLDFGVAMSAVTEQAETAIVGKWLYMSPEHTMSRKIDHRSDLFSLGVVTYLLCTGYMPFSGADPKEIVRKIRSGQYTPIQQLAPNVPPELVALIGRLLASNPDERPNNGHEVMSVLDDIARHYRMEYSGTDMAELLKKTFPDVHEEASDLVEIIPGIETAPTEADAANMSTRSSSSVSAGSNSRSLSRTPSPPPTPAPPAPIPLPTSRVVSRSFPKPDPALTEAPKLAAAPWWQGISKPTLIAIAFSLLVIAIYLLARR